MPESNKIIEDLKELGPLELRSVANLMWNIKWYRELYNDIIHEIVDIYEISTKKVDNATSVINNNLSYLRIGERMIVFNKLAKPFIENYIKGNATKEELDTILKALDDMDTALVVSMEDISINKIKNAIKETESTIESLGLNYGEKWLTYSVLNETYIDTIEKGIT